MSERPPRHTRLQEQIEARRTQMGLSMRELSLKAGLNETAIKAIMGGRSVSPRGATLQAIARALDTTVEELIGQPLEAKPSAAAEQDAMIETHRERERHLEQEHRMIGARLEEVKAMIAALRSLRPHPESDFDDEPPTPTTTGASGCVVPVTRALR